MADALYTEHFLQIASIAAAVTLGVFRILEGDPGEEGAVIHRGPAWFLFNACGGRLRGRVGAAIRPPRPLSRSQMSGASSGDPVLRSGGG